MKWIYGKSDGVKRLFNPEYITAVDFKNKCFFTRDTSGGWDIEEEEMELLEKLTGRKIDEDETTNRQSKTSTGTSRKL